MKITKVPYEQVGRFSKRDMSYIQQEEELRQFVKAWPSLESIRRQIDIKSKQPINRAILHEHLTHQYRGIDTSDAVLSHIEQLKENNSFTIVTAHQPSLMTGPLYYIFKICSVINLCRQLNTEFSEYNFIPVFVSGGEDHDLEEINHLELYGKTVSWATNQAGSVGRMNTDGLADALDQCFSILTDNERSQIYKRDINLLLSESNTYGDFQLRLVNYLFKDNGLVFLNMDDAKLKELFTDEMHRELTEQVSHDIIQKTIARLDAIGQKAQATPREINLFYLGDGYRSRIEKIDGQYQIVDQDIRFSEAELLTELKEHPERFSPNVVMRPLYQEKILPNLAYVGGGGEIAYWTERQEQFDAFGIHYPILIRRNSAMILDRSGSKLMKSLGFSLDEIFDEKHELEHKYVSRNPSNDIDVSQEKSEIERVLQDIADKAQKIDTTLKKSALAEATKIIKSIEHLEHKLVKAEKRNQDSTMNKIAKLSDKLFPDNGLQERKENIWPYLVRYGNGLISFLIDNLNPLDRQFAIVEIE